MHRAVGVAGLRTWARGMASRGGAPSSWGDMEMQRLRQLKEAVAHKRDRLKPTLDNSMPLSHRSQYAEVAGRAVNALAMNQYIVACTRTREAAFVDCGEPPERFLAWAEQNNYNITKVLVTHGHPDHVAGLAATKEALPNVPIYLHPSEVETMRAATEIGQVFSLEVPTLPEVDVLLEDGDVVEVGELRFRTIHTPGHSVGHVCFHEPTENLLFSGDLLFHGSVGRTDLPGADSKTLSASLLKLVKMIPELDTQVFPGHMGMTTFRKECASNFFLAPLVLKHRNDAPVRR